MTKQIELKLTPAEAASLMKLKSILQRTEPNTSTSMTVAKAIDIANQVALLTAK